MLLVGDICAYLFSLIFTLTIRYGSLPDKDLVFQHLLPFSILFLLFIIIGLVVGLYDKRAAFVKRNVGSLLLQNQFANIILGIVFFYFAPVAIAPKVNLFIYFIISTVVLYVWRLVMFPVIVGGRKVPAVLVGSGADADDLYEEINSDGRYGLYFSSKLSSVGAGDLAQKIGEIINNNQAQIIVADLRGKNSDDIMPTFYDLIFRGYQVLDMSDLYENVFDRIPLSLAGQRWLVENSTTAVGNRRVYDAVKRLVDIVLSVAIGIVSLITYPFIALAIKLEDRGPLFVFQERIGKNGKTIKIAKWRSMTTNDGGVYSNGSNKSDNKITKVGKFIRMTRLDELPQVWSVIKGDQSLIGPRPELPALVKIYEKEVEHYNARHLIKPGLSGWAQIYHRAHPHHAVAINDTKDKLSYDLYYVKNRSFGLDAKIALQTLRAIISKQGV